MKYNEECECCGHVLTAYTHNLNKPLVSALAKLVAHYAKTKQPANLQKNLILTKNQYNNFQKLQYFNLVKRIESGWLPTPLGDAFIHGETSVINPVATLGKNILDSDHEAWETHSGQRCFVGVKEIDVFCYKRREEYQAEKSNQQVML